MNWLSFFMGCTAAWVFMGIVLFAADIIRKIFIGKPMKEPFQDELVAYWNNANETASCRNSLLTQINDSLRDISSTIHNNRI